MASYALIAGFGAFILWRKLSGRGTHAHSHHDHAHHDHPNHDHAHHDHGSQHAHHDHAHNHDHHHDAGGQCETCGHSHAPDPAALTAAKVSAREAWGIVMAVGIRPCTGAIVVLSFALLNGLYAAGVASVFVMALGTAITVSALAVIAVRAKGFALQLAGTNAAWLGRTIEIIGALCVMLLGLGLLHAGLTA
jgi:nickel/cobalt transporter (NicO) family protein